MDDSTSPKTTVTDIAAKGGRARAEALSPEERRRIAQFAAGERWARAGRHPIPVATHTGKLRVGNIEFDCAVLEDGTRVVSETRFMAAMGMYRSGALSTRRERAPGGALPPLFLAYKNLQPFVDRHLGGVHYNPVQYITLAGRVATSGIRADFLPKVCEVWIDAERAGVLGARQRQIAAKADILFRGFAHVGIIALVDEATGFQDERARDALAKILEAFVAKELRKWVRTFPVEFYKELFRLRGIPYDGTVRRPAYVGHLTNDLVYARLAPGVLEELRAKNPVTENGKRKHRHHQWLTDNVGHPKLLEHLSAVTTLMKVSDDWDLFKAMLDRGKPKYSKLPLFRDVQDEA